MKDYQTILGIDIGGSGIKSAPVNVDEGKLVKEAIKVTTPESADPSSMLPIVEDIIKHFQWKETIGCGFPGVIKKGVVQTAANLSKDWVGVNLKDRISKISFGTVKVLNDADAAALAEMEFGAGKYHNCHGGGVILVVTLGTGIGSALFIDGHLVPNTEFGHMEMDGRDAEKWAATVIREQENLSWQDWSKRVNKFLQRMEMLLSPDLIIIGGGVSENPERFFPFLDIKTKFVAAEMANDAGIIGAALGTIIRQ